MVRIYERLGEWLEERSYRIGQGWENFLWSIPRFNRWQYEAVHVAFEAERMKYTLLRDKLIELGHKTQLLEACEAISKDIENSPEDRLAGVIFREIQAEKSNEI